MGFVGNLLSKAPGGPVSIAKCMLQAYNRSLATFPGKDTSKALCHALASRDHTVKGMSDSQINSFIEVSTSIGELIILVIALEIPTSLKKYNIETTIRGLADFYSKYAPGEMASLDRWEDIWANYRERLAEEFRSSSPTKVCLRRRTPEERL